MPIPLLRRLATPADLAAVHAIYMHSDVAPYLGIDRASLQEFETEFDELLEKAKVKAPTRALVDIDDVGMACAFLAHDAARLMTGQVLYIDGGYNIID